MSRSWACSCIPILIFCTLRVRLPQPHGHPLMFEATTNNTYLCSFFFFFEYFEYLPVNFLVPTPSPVHFFFPTTRSTYSRAHTLLQVAGNLGLYADEEQKRAVASTRRYTKFLSCRGTRKRAFVSAIVVLNNNVR